ncbi:hypothetical protein DRW03_21230 [Corallococcus sp. H22C18031201]|nr:hypothetical protein DRW03_21230 [Corallococcus sp. H22C18031201]
MSGGGLKVGDLYVVVTAAIGEAVAELGKLVKAVEKTAAQVKAAAKDMGEIGMVVAAGIAGAVTAATQSNERLKKEVTRITDLLYTFAADVGDAFAPLVKRIGDFLSRLVARFQALSPETKRAAASFAAWVAGAGLAVGAIGKVAGVVEGMAKGLGMAIQVSGGVLSTLKKMGPAVSTAFDGLRSLMRMDMGAVFKRMDSGLGSMAKSIADFGKSMPSMLSGLGRMLMSFGAALVPILAVAAALAAITLLAGAVYKNWGDIKYISSEAWGSMAASVRDMMQGLSGLAQQLGDVFSTAFDSVATTIQAIVERSLEYVAYLVRGSAKLLAPIAHAVKMANAEAALKPLQSVTGKDLAKGLGAVADKAVTVMAGAKASLDGAAGSLGAKATALAKDAAENATAAAKATRDAMRNNVGFALSNAGDGAKQMMGAIMEGSGVQGIVSDIERRLQSLTGLLTGDAGNPNVRHSEGRQKELEEERARKEHGRSLSYAQLQSYHDEDVARQMKDAEEAESAAFAAAMERITTEQKNDEELTRLSDDAAEAARVELLTSMRADMSRSAAAFVSMRQEAEALAEAAKQAIQDARDSILQRMVGSLGKLGDVINTAIQGFQAGGIWGAIIAVVADLLTGAKQFQDLIAMTNAAIGDLVEGLGPLATGAQSLVGAVSRIVNVVMGVLQPLLEHVGRSIEPIIPPLMMVAQLLEGLQPVLTMFGQAGLGVLKPLNWLTTTVLKGLFEIIRYVGIAILWIVKGIGGLWNGIIGAIQTVFRALGDISIFGAHPLGFLKGWARSLDKVKVDTDALARSIQEMEHLSWDAALAKAKETAEVLKNRDALQEATEALTNVPAAWKVALRRFDAADPQDGPTDGGKPGSGGSSGNGSGTPTPDSSGGEHAATPISGDSTARWGGLQINIHGADIDDAMRTAMETADRLGLGWARRAIGGMQRQGPRYGTP